jgi:thioredoxin 1
MIVELFYTEGCGKCASMREELKTTAEQTIPGVVWREVNVVKEIDYAVELGVLTLPAIAINKELVFTSLPNQAHFIKALQQRSSIQEP